MTRGPRLLRPFGVWNFRPVSHALCLALPCLLGTACHHDSGHEAPRVTSGTARDRGPCRGTDLSLNALREVCKVPGNPKPSPPASRLRAELSPPELSVRSGGQTTLTVVMTNLENGPLEFDMQLGCGAFDSSVYREGQTERVDQVLNGRCSDTGGVCAPGRAVRVTLEPRGVVRMNLDFDARIVQWDENENRCVDSSERAIPPGRYGLRVQLPFVDPVIEESRSWETRWAEGSVVVLP